MLHIALHVLVNFKVECTSQRVRVYGDGDVLCGDRVGMVVRSCVWGWGGNGSQVYMGWGGDGEKNHGDGVGMGPIFNTVSLFSSHTGYKISNCRYTL